MYWSTVPSAARVSEATASSTRQAVYLLPSCSHEVHYCLSNYPPDFSPTCQSSLQYGSLLLRPAWAYDHVFRLFSLWRKLLHVDVAPVPLQNRGLEAFLELHLVA